MPRIPAPWQPRHAAQGIGLAMTNALVATVSVTVLAVATSLIASTLVVMPIAAVGLWWTLLGCRHLATAERSRLAALTGTSIIGPTELPPTGNMWRRFLDTVRNRDRWCEFGYLTFMSVWGFVSFATITAVWAPALAGLFYGLGHGWGTSTIFGQSTTGHSWLWVALPVASAVWLVAFAPPLTWALSRVDIATARRLLSRNELCELRRVAEAAEASRVAAVSSAEEERRRIERDLHDGAQQRLIALSLDLGRAKAALPNNPELAKQLVDSTHAEAKEVMKDLRDLVRGLRPVILEDRGLDAALSAVVARCPFPVDIDVRVDPRPPAAVESAAYFAVTEALTNAMRHAVPSHAKVSVIRHGPRLMVTVLDNGRGGATMPLDPSTGSGLAGLADRANALGGRLTLTSPAGGGTRLEVELPCR